jgi:glucose-6-phosphate 1-epimerase
LGLEGSDYYDQLDQCTKKNQTDVITINEEVDRIYTGVRNKLIINDTVFKRRIQISSTGNGTVVVWNPWIKKTEKITDLKNQAYKEFVCVEIGNIADDFINIPPGGEYVLSTTYQILRD